jgi:hypothetical protein
MKNFRFFAIALAIIALVPTMLVAQEPPGMVTVTRVKIKPDMVESYKKLIKDEVLPAYKKSEIEWIDTWEVAPFGDGPEMAFAAPLKSFAMFDEATPLVKVLGAEAAAAMISKLRKHAVSINRSVYRFEQDLSVTTDGEAKVAVMWEANVTPGNTDRAMHWLKTELKPAMEKAGVVNCLVHSQIFGGSTDLMAVVMHKGFAALDKGHPIFQAHEPMEASKVMARGESLFENATVITLRHLPDLSYDKTK